MEFNTKILVEMCMNYNNEKINLEYILKQKKFEL